MLLCRELVAEPTQTTMPPVSQPLRDWEHAEQASQSTEEEWVQKASGESQTTECMSRVSVWHASNLLDIKEGVTNHAIVPNSPMKESILNLSMPHISNGTHGEYHLSVGALDPSCLWPVLHPCARQALELGVGVVWLLVLGTPAAVSGSVRCS
jgi:hypothetical protein